MKALNRGTIEGLILGIILLGLAEASTVTIEQLALAFIGIIVILTTLWSEYESRQYKSVVSETPDEDPRQ